MATLVNIEVTGLAGPRCTVEATTEWTIFEVQRAIGEKLQVPALWQTLFKGNRLEKLAREEAVGTLMGEDAAEKLQVTLVASPPPFSVLEGLLKNPDTSVRKALAEAFAVSIREGHNSEAAGRALVELVTAHIDGFDSMDLARVPGVVGSLVLLLRNEKRDTSTDAAEALSHLAEDAENQTIIAGIPGAIPSLVALLPRNVSAAASALGNLARNPSNRVAIAGTSEAIPLLVALLQNANSRSAASWALAALAHSADIAVIIARHPDAIPFLVQCLCDWNVSEDRSEAARALGSLASHPDTHAAILGNPAAVRLLVDLLQSCCKMAAWAVGNLAANPDNHAAILRIPEALPNLLRLLYRGYEDAGFALAALVCNSDNNVAIESVASIPRVISAVVELLRSTYYNLQDKERAAKVLLNLAHCCAAQETIKGTPGAIPLLAKLVQDCSTNAQEDAAHAFGQFLLVIAGGFQEALSGLVDALESPSVLRRAAGAAALLNLAQVNEANRVILPAILQVLPSLVAMLQHGCALSKGAAARTLSICVSHADLVTSGDIPPAAWIPVREALRLVQKGDLRARLSFWLRACRAVQERSITCVLEAIQVFVALLLGNGGSGKKVAMVALQAFAENAENRATIEKSLGHLGLPLPEELLELLGK